MLCNFKRSGMDMARKERFMNFKNIALSFGILGILVSAYLFISSLHTHNEITALAKQSITERLVNVAEHK